MYEYKVKIRKSFGEVSDDARLIDGKVFLFRATTIIRGGHADGEIMMVPIDPTYPKDAPRYLALGDLERVY